MSTLSKPSLHFSSPNTGHKLSPSSCGNYLIGADDTDKFPILNGIPRFSPFDNYTQSFGYQWSLFSRTQLDYYSGQSQSEQRFYASTNWTPDFLYLKNILEVGSGAGRFSEVVLRTTYSFLYSIDYSVAVDVNQANNQSYLDRLFLAQASIYSMPFADDLFDCVFCLGVLQHTPSFEQSVQSLISKAKPGGQIVVDFYPIKGWYTKLHSKYLLRPFTKLLPKPLLLKLIRLSVWWTIPLFDFLCFIRLGLLTRFLPVVDLRTFPPALTVSQRYEWAVLDTFDAYSPQYDNPCRLADVVRMFSSNGCNVVFAGEVLYRSGRSTVVRAVKC